MPAAAALAEPARGMAIYATAQSCLAARQFSAEQCANAAANAEAEFIEKAPHFGSRAACEVRFGRDRCSLAIEGRLDLALPRSAVTFVPRQQGFGVRTRTVYDITVVPLFSGLSFLPRSVLRRDTHVSPRLARRNLIRAAGRGAVESPSGPVSYGVPAPEGKAGPVPIPPAMDTDFDCGAIIDPALKGVGSGCYPVHGR